MRITVELARITECTATECAYNMNNNCEARAVTIGNSIAPMCDTYLHVDERPDIELIHSTSGVGPCKTTACVHNENLHCASPSIAVEGDQSSAVCGTFFAR